jgi:APA family basic amino acid/polyamine antiporter
MLGAVAATGTVIAIFAVLSDKDFGYNFQGALAYNSLTGVTDGSTATTPWFTVLAGILTSNVFLSVIIMGVFAIWIWFWVPAEIAYSTRSMLAWSFDRVAPDRLGYVSERTHTPVVAIGLSTTISIVFMWFIAFKAVAFLTLVEVLLVIWGTVMIAAVIFPVARRRMFEGSPAARIRVAGVPLLSILGFLSTAFFVAVIWLLWDDPNAAGALINFHGSQTSTFWIVVGTLIGAVAWYVGTRIYRRRQGINLDLAFAQIPIE